MSAEVSTFTEALTQQAQAVDLAMARTLNEWDDRYGKSVGGLVESIKYSLIGGGKRIRPVLAAWVAENFGTPVQKIIPWALAIEMIHTYSLIHDDLPCMDDDEERRGRPTNHVMFGESTALLAGDGLLTEAFHLLAREYASEPALGLKLVALLGHAAGVGGMVGGQYQDLNTADENATVPLLAELHARKTGALISAAVEGAALIAGLSANDSKNLKKYGEHLGLAFQIADDILDAESEEAGKSYVPLLGLEETQNELQKVTREGFAVLDQMSRPCPRLREALQWNLERKS